MGDHHARAELVQLEVDRLVCEAHRCTDAERFAAIADELDYLVEALREIRREQLLEELERARAARAPRRRRWLGRRPRTVPGGDHA